MNDFGFQNIVKFPELEKKFLKDGFVIVDLNNKELLKNIKETLFNHSLEFLKLDEQTSMNSFYDYTNEYIELSKLNDLRLHLIKKMADDNKIKSSVFNLAKDYIFDLVGNEIAMQRAINLSIQIPNDVSSVLPLHTDVLSGNSPYEVVFWLPLVDCYKTKSMYILPLEKNIELMKNFSKYKNKSIDEIFEDVKADLVWVDVPCGKALIFSHSLFHGNILNVEDSTRWTFNCRFKSLLSPYGSKQLGEAFLPVNLRAATQIGANYKSMDSL